MSLTRLGQLALVSALFVACAPTEESTEDPASGAGAINESGNAHLLAVAKCDKAHLKASNQAESTNAIIQAEAAFATCLKAANDRVVTKIEWNLTEAGSGYVGKTAPSIATVRQQSEALCAELDKASPNFGGSLSRMEAASCRSTRERFLASLIDSYVALGDASAEIPEARSHHRSCYRKYDKRLEAAGSTQSSIQANYELGDCVERRLGLLSQPLAAAQIENDPALGPVEARTAAVQAVTKGINEAGSQLCAVLSEAGENGTGTASLVIGSGCTVRIRENTFAAVHAYFE